MNSLLALKNIKVLIAVFALLISTVAIFASPSVGANITEQELNEICKGDTAKSPICQSRNQTDDPVKNILVDVIDIMLFAVGALTVVFVIYGGFKYVKSSGDSAKVSEAKNTIIYALVGLVVAFFASRLIVFLINRLL